ncbi:hypothetical protein BH11CYA1_BH11CYA1_05640 [soil metagenome]
MTDGVQDPANDGSKAAETSEPSELSDASNTSSPSAVEASPEVAAKAVVDTNVGAAQRRSPWQSSMAAIQYIGQASATDEVQVRTSDRVTVVALLVCCIAEVLSLVYTPMASMRLAFIAISDVVLAVAVTMFLVYRLGILSSLGKRQALICWQLMMGCIFLGIFLCVNVAAGVALGVSAMYPAELP